MNIEDFVNFCLSKPGTSEHFPFDEDTLVLKVADKMFAATGVASWESGQPTINLKCDPDLAVELRERYQAVMPGYHMNKTHWNTVAVNQDVSDKEIVQMVNHSYDLIVAKLPKSVREQLQAKN